jgi:hypothetical protein
MKMLLDTNVWIADTGETLHATPNSSAMIKKSERNGNDSVTMKKMGKGRQLNGMVTCMLLYVTWREIRKEIQK